MATLDAGARKAPVAGCSVCGDTGRYHLGIGDVVCMCPAGARLAAAPPVDVAKEQTIFDAWFCGELSREHAAGGHKPGAYLTCPKCLVWRSQQSGAGLSAAVAFAHGGRAGGGWGALVAFIIIVAIFCVAASPRSNDSKGDSE